MEAYINYITTIATAGEDMRPVHGIVPFSSLEETIAPDLKGFLGYGPVRVGNQAEKQTQNDAYGSIVLAAGQMFVDERLPKMGDESLFHLLEISGESALAHAFEPDAGLWEYRARMLPAHLFGDAMLGRLRSSRQHRPAAQHRRPRQVLDGSRSRPAREDF